jgi:hypothetical protein
VGGPLFEGSGDVGVDVDQAGDYEHARGIHNSSGGFLAGTTRLEAVDPPFTHCDIKNSIHPAPGIQHATTAYDQVMDSIFYCQVTPPGPG